VPATPIRSSGHLFIHEHIGEPRPESDWRELPEAIPRISPWPDLAAEAAVVVVIGQPDTPDGEEHLLQSRQVQKLASGGACLDKLLG
jgi:hypothetical protein